MGNDMKAAQTPMARVGERLREARERKSLTIDQVQKQTSIHSTVLKALEEGRCDEMLTATYVKSFLKKYAEHLGLDTRAILGEYAVTRQPAPVTAVGKIAEPVVEAPAAKRGLLKTAVISIAVIALISFAGSRTIGFIKHIASRKAPAAKAGEAPAAKKAAASKKDQSAEKRLAAPSIPRSAPLKLIIKANQPVLVRIRADGDLVFERVLQNGAAESFTAKDRINIYVAKAEAVSIALNGKNLGSPGKGIVKNIEITRAGIKFK